jgi:hypothetical protein
MPWRFVFIDESGEAGPQSPYFVAAAVDCPAETLPVMRRIAAPYRYHLEMHKEVKTAKLLGHERPRRKASELFCVLMEEGVSCTVVHLDKAAYTGPYLGTTGKKPWPTRFRNFVLRLLLENHFTENPVANKINLELIFDRVSLAKKDREEMERYISGNWNLPTIQYYTHVDSEYTDAILWPDLAVTIVKEHLSGAAEQPEAAAARALMHCVDITSP